MPALAYVILGQPGSIFMIAETIDPDQIDALIGIVTEHFESYPGMRAFANRGSIISGNEGGTRSVNLDISGATWPRSTAWRAPR